MKIGFIGGGNMGEAMLSAILHKRVSQPQSITVSDKEKTRREYLRQKYGVTVTGDNQLAIRNAEVVVLAIKPQNLVEVMIGLKGCLKASQLVLSIIAGARVDTIRRGLGYERVVRAMPNTPAQIGEGMTVWTATSQVTGKQKEYAARILGVMGKEIYLDEEKYLDMVTAISGSGPAYFFLFIEALTEAAAQIGLPREMAQELVVQTMLGSGHFLQKSGRTPAELRRMVTSPGGTTAAALAQFEQGGFTELVKRAITAAYKRAQELGN
ncbi:MAG: pyrroline-5-carboxylate reductase [Chloroflexi bacterium]|nr:pyrroline-5-carboxylate reductase [Chloroflexota bacterium]